jgi:C4-dicarboxylate transporter DctM subunit
LENQNASRRFESGTVDSLTIPIIIFSVVAIIFILSGIPIAYSFLFLATAFIFFIMRQPAAFMKLGTTPFSQFYNFSFTPFPLFVLLAYIINETKIPEEIFTVANNWLSRIRGGLVVSSIIGEAIMGACVGISAICMLSIGKVALPQIEKLNYNKQFSLGALLSGGVLGVLIPPSIPLIIYGILTRESVAQLLMAGVIPGIILTIMLATLAMIVSLKHPDWTPRPITVSWREKLFSLRKVWPIFIIVLGIIGVVSLGIATATESAGVGVVLTLLVAVVSYQFRLRNLFRAMIETAKVTGMIGLMFIAATVFTYVLGVSGLAVKIADFIVSAGLSTWMVIIAINLILLLMGCLMDTLCLLLVSVPIFVPLVEALGFNPIWFGVVMAVNLEIGLITPPIGLNTFIASQLFNVSITDLLRGVLPFLAILLVFLAIIVIFPETSLWLPSMMQG